jgi:Protein of unknown function (DUF2892)
MKCNSGIIDRAVRIIVGLILIVLAATEAIGWWGYIGVVALITGAVGFCPAYAMLGCTTCAVKK